MRCNQEQFDVIKPKLEALGYLKRQRTNCGTEGYYLVNNMDGNDTGVYAVIHKSRKENHRRTVFEDWNEKLFLALAAMTDLAEGIVGEYFMRGQSLNQLKSDPILGEYMQVITQNDSRSNYTFVLKPNTIEKYGLRKATAEELIAHFTKPAKQETPAKRKFTTPVAMKCNPFEMGGIVADLQKLGYTLKDFEWDKCAELPWVFTNYGDEHDKVTNARGWDDVEHIILDSFQPELFLAIAAMSETDVPYEGEWFMCLESSDGEENYKPHRYYTKGKIYKTVYINGVLVPTPKYNRNAFRKATVEELKQHFSKKFIACLPIGLGKAGYGKTYKIFIDGKLAQENVTLTTGHASDAIQYHIESLLRSKNTEEFGRELHEEVERIIKAIKSNSKALSDLNQVQKTEPAPKLKVGDFLPLYLSDKLQYMFGSKDMGNQKFRFPFSKSFKVLNITNDKKYEVVDSLFMLKSHRFYFSIAEVDNLISQHSTKVEQDFGTTDFASVEKRILSECGLPPYLAQVQKTEPAPKLKVGDFLPLYLDDKVSYFCGHTDMGRRKFSLSIANMYKVSRITATAEYEVSLDSQTHKSSFFYLPVKEVDTIVSRQNEVIKSKIEQNRHALGNLSDSNKCLINESTQLQKRQSEIHKERKSIEADCKNLRAAIKELEKDII